MLLWRSRVNRLRVKWFERSSLVITEDLRFEDLPNDPEALALISL
ncbi:hypothetical protein SAMN05421858_4575 [Haladaptatus litoreus]|uniref:Uncharacterized protein n=1 Tax=Haladaptatus litoreus TaxID=553468 RepID=A0A1N7EWZ8_9EURY|nr:hypothetical protein SAMN05421858_4575 [Haladaptatus litoreus]